MILIFFLCLKLSILHLCMSDLGYQCTTAYSSNNPKIFLIDRAKTLDGWDIEPFYNIQWQLNSKFLRFCGNYYNIQIVSPEESKEHKNVIHFAVPDYDDGKLPKDFVYAGNISKIDDAECTIPNPNQPELTDCNEIVNLVSKSVSEINDGHLYNFVQNIQIRESRYYYLETEITPGGSCEPFYPNISDLTIVLLCLRGPDFIAKEVNIQLPLRLIQVKNCTLNHNRRGLLAVLAPKPFELPFEYSVPTLFYETPYLFSENKTTFPNSMNLLPWRLLKYGFLTFIQTVGWQRVAIVTDNSEYSLDFEDELTALFNKERLMYTVIRCEDANCEMEKIVQKLSRVSPRIVIANVEEKHVKYLFQNSDHKITWLVRDMVGKRQNQYLNNNRVAFSISLSIDTNTKKCNVENNILTGLSSIAQAYQNRKGKDYKLKKPEFYRRFADITKQVTPEITEATVVVHKLYSLEVVSKMSVNATGAKLLNYTNPFESDIPTDGTAHCLVTSYDYHNPCEDHLVMFLMFIFMLFLLTFLLITCYFDKTSPFNDIRYQNF